MGGHSLLLIVVFSSPLGILGGLLLSDVRRRFKSPAIIVRTVVSLILFAGYFFFLISIRPLSPFLMNNGWLLIPIGGPIFVAVISEFLLKKAAISKVHSE
jgi:MFS-type transporter involved in bile tolerance (Atg22 family)